MHRKSFLTLSEAVAWLAIGRPSSASELMTSIEFALEAEAISIRSELIKAFERYAEAASAGFVRSYGRYHARPLVYDLDAATLPIPASAYHDFRRFDMLNDGLRRGHGLYPRYSPAGMDTADDVDRGGPAYSAVRVSRGELVDHFGLEVAECGKSERLHWATDNPSAFVELAHKAIALARRDVLTTGITYERTGEHFEQSLFEPFEADEEDLVAVDHAPTTHIRVDSKTIERPIAETLDSAEQVGLFAKLPSGFKIDTPLGTYNPDWAVTGGSNGAPMVHLVSESKSDFTALRDNEYAKVRCGEAHFKAIGVEYVKAVSAEDILERLVEDS